jgi:serine phosphatase RsbU (regulator of sigma subunit)
MSVSFIATQHLRPVHLSTTARKTISVYDLDANEARRAANRIRSDVKGTRDSDDKFKEALSIIGGRLSYINKVARARDMVESAKHMLQVEQAWLRAQIGLIPDHDDDVCSVFCASNSE